MRKTIITGIMAGTGLFAIAATSGAGAQTALGADCAIGKAVEDVSYREAHDVYRCLGDTLYNGYQQGDKRWIPAEFVRDYRNWTPASTLPANPGFHSDRFLFTYVNAVGAAEYTKFKPTGAKMPVGTVIAKESFKIDDAGKAAPGPLFFMQKVADGTSPRTNDWYYMAVAPGGTPMAVNVYTACHECHSGFADSDFLGYPVEEVRVHAR